MTYMPIDSALFTENRKSFAKRMKPSSIAIFNSNDIQPTNADGVRKFIQNADLFYMSGVDQEHSILAIFPDAVDEKHREVLFVKKTNKDIAIWEGPKLTKEEATKISGVKTVYWTEQLGAVLNPLINESERIYLNTNEHLRANVSVESRDERFIKQCKRDYPLHKYGRIAPITSELRKIKSPTEVELIKTACHITGKAVRRLLKFIKPGVWGFEVEAEIYHEFLKNRSRGPAFQSIVASGANSCALHYLPKDRKLNDGEVVLIDFGAEYAGYSSDVTRTLPVSGKFTPRQKEVYNAVLNVQRAAKEMLTAGNNMEQYKKDVARVMEKELIDIKLLDPSEVKKQDKKNPLYLKYYMHSPSHFMGLDTHDVGSLHGEFESGMVFTCEPGIYIKEESLGIRLENDILITDNGPVDLTKDIPIEPDEIEELMNS